MIDIVQDHPTVFIVDDDPEFLDSLSILVASMGLRFQCYASGLEFLSVFDGQSPGCVILDVRMPELDGLAVTKTLAQHAYTLPVIIMTAYAEVPAVVRASQLGVVAFFQKHTFGETELGEASQNAITLDGERRSAQKRKNELKAQFAALNPTEQQVLQMLLKGCDHMSISKTLSISRRTVENHRSRIMKRMAVENFIELIALAYEIGLPD